MSRKPPAKAAAKTVTKTALPEAKAAEKTGAPSPEQVGPPVVGIGASAGGLEAFTQLLGALPIDTGMAFVLVQHLEPTHKSVLTPLLARATKMPVQEVREGMLIEPNHVYVIPANADMSVLDGLLHIVGRQAGAGRHLPVDYFLSSLAEARGQHAIGVILSGTASDGTAGIKAIKQAGGITFAQDPESAKFDGMPRNAIASGYVDLVLSPERIAKELARLVRHPLLGLLATNETPQLQAQDEEWVRFFRVLRGATGVDFSLYKQSTIQRRLARRMAVCKAETLAAYLKILESTPREVDALLDELLILVTEFFRDSDVFRVLRDEIFAKLLEEKPAGEPMRIWVAGCSTGEEAYSIAICLLEALGEKSASTQIQIFATDVSESAIETARNGIYSAADVKGLSKERLRKFFTAVDGKFQVNQPIRELCVFARHDLSRDPPFSKLDLISCRNVLIYMDALLQKRILAGFHWALRSGGVLLLGKSESLGAHADLFSVTDRKNKFFRKTLGAHVPLTMAQPAYEQAFAGKPPFKEPPAAIDLEREADQVVWERYAHAGLVVNDDLQILHVRGDTSPYIHLVPGKASLQLMRALREEIVLAVRAAIQKARHSEHAVRSEGIRFRRNGHICEATIEVRPLARSGLEKCFLILFEQTAVEPAVRRKGQARGAKAGKADKAREQEAVRLREELARNREYVQAIIRDQEATNEELKTANEEALSSMEELQSTNEELETAKEELQSSNEELVTLNEQLGNRNSELGQLSTDLGNVLSGIDIPVVILDSGRRIRRFTPPAEKLLGLIAADIGRPIEKLRIGMQVSNLDNLILTAIKTGEVVAQDVQADSGRWYLLRIHPFITGEDKVMGVLMAFMDIDVMKKLQLRTMERADQGEANIRDVLESAGMAILAAGRDGRITLANATVETMFGYKRDVLLGEPLEVLLPERFREIEVQRRATWFEKPENIAAVELAGQRKDGSEFPIEVSLRSITTDGELRGVAFISDVTERKKNEDVLARLRDTSDHLWRLHDLTAGLEEILDAAMGVLGADFGNIQMLRPEDEVLEIAAQRGFGPDFLEHFREVSAAESSSCGRSLRSGERIIIEDVNTDADYAPHRAAAAAAGYRAVQSTPLSGTDGRRLGMFSTHFREPHRPSERELNWFDRYAHQAEQFIERVVAEEELRKLTGALIGAQEAENREIARELHDVYSQELTGLRMQLSSLKKDAKSEADLTARLSEISKKIGGIAEALHQASRALHPAVLEDLGFEPALRQECDSFQKTYGISTEFTAKDMPPKIPQNVALCLYRVAQESLRNISKHAAGADQVRVSLTGGSGGITLVVEDTGDGFELEEGMRKGGLGLISMEERLRLVNGKLTIQSAPGKGTVVSAFVPLLGGGVDEPRMQSTPGRRSQSGLTRYLPHSRHSRV